MAARSNDDSMTNLPVRVARWSAHHPWHAIAGWLVFVAVCLGAGIAVGNNSAVTADYRVGEAGRAEAIAADGGLQRRPVEHVLITAPVGGVLNERAADSAAQDVIDRMSSQAMVADVSDPIPASNSPALRVDLTLDVEEREASAAVANLHIEIEAVQDAHPEVLVQQTGRASIGQAVEQQRGQDITQAELITLPITLITLLLVFRSLSLALVPVVLALSSIAASVGLSMLVSHIVPDAGVGTNVILLIGLAVGVDYSLFYLKREREERARAGGSLSATAAVDLAAATSGRAVVLSGVAVAVSSATLYFVGDVIFSSLATGAVLVTLVAVASSITVLPATLAKLGAIAEHRTSRRRKPMRTPKANRLSAALMRFVGQCPALTLSVATLAMLSLSAPVLGMKITDMGVETHPPDLPAMQTYERLTTAYPEVRAIHQVVVHSDDPATATALAELKAMTADDPAMGESSTLRVSADGRTRVLDIAVPHFVGEQTARDSLQRLREEYLPLTLGQLDRVEYAVSGDVARNVDYPQHQQERLPWVVGALLLVTFGITAWAFRSVVLGAIGVVLNLLSVGAAMGVMTWVFQEKWAEGLLDFTSTGSIGSRVPLFLFVILFGLSMDYQVFLISRIREAATDGMSTREAVFDGMRNSTSVITSAAIVMVTVFAAFVAVHLIEMKQTGLGLAVAVLLDAFIIRTLILPSLMLLLGDRVWWPTRMQSPRDSAASMQSATLG
ncbi:MMPL family transporter [Georgenia alba]|uniref:MMPL family transporter n=1 Tax=Georgenia alba TaxID=2233858 RepID=A0ABW2QDJ9_9MICO